MNNPVRYTDPSGMVTGVKVTLVRSGNSTRCEVILSWGGGDMYSGFMVKSVSVTNGSFLFPAVYGSLGPTVRNVPAATAGTVSLGFIDVPTNVTSVTIIVKGLYGYNMRTGQWEPAIFTLTFPGKIN